LSRRPRGSPAAFDKEKKKKDVTDNYEAQCAHTAGPGDAAKTEPKKMTKLDDGLAKNPDVAPPINQKLRRPTVVDYADEWGGSDEFRGLA